MPSTSSTNQSTGSWPLARRYQGPEARRFALLLSPVKNGGHPKDGSISDMKLDGNPIVHGVMRRYATDDIFDDAPDIDLSKTDPDFFVDDDKKAGVIPTKTIKQPNDWDKADDYFLSGNTSGVYTRGAQTLPISFDITMDQSDAIIDSAIAVEDYNVFEKSFTPRARQRASLSGLFDTVDDDIVGKDDYAGLDYVFAVPEIPDDLPAPESFIKGPLGDAASSKSKKMRCREVSANIPLSRQSSLDFMTNEFKKTTMAKTELDEAIVLDAASKKSCEIVVPHLHREIKICQKVDAMMYSHALFPDALESLAFKASEKNVRRESSLSTVQHVLTDAVPYLHPRVEMLRLDSAIAGVETMHPFGAPFRPQHGLVPIQPNSTSPSTVTVPFTDINIMRCKNGNARRTDSVHPTKLLLRGWSGSNKPQLRKSPLSVTGWATEDINVLEPNVKSRAQAIRSNSMKCPLRGTDGVHPSKIKEFRPRAGRASALAVMEHAYPERHTVTARSPIVRHYSEMPHYGWSDGIHPNLLDRLHPQGLTAAAAQPVIYRSYDY